MIFAPSAYLKSVRGLVLPLLFFGLLTNLFVLVSPIFMMQVLDRVVPSGNLQTLVVLFLVAVLALATNAGVVYFRDSSLGNLGRWLEEKITQSLLRIGLKERRNLQTDVEMVRRFIEDGGAVLMLNVPWIPLFLFALALIHPAFTVMAIALGALLFGLRILNTYLTSNQVKATEKKCLQAKALVENADRHGGISGLMSLGENLCKRYMSALKTQNDAKTKTYAKVGFLSGLSGLVQGVAQISALSLGAALVTQQQLTPGGMIGASIILAKLVGIFDSLGSYWMEFRDVKTSYSSLMSLSEKQENVQTGVGELTGLLKADSLIYPRGAGQQPRLDRVSFAVEPGECVAILGESGSGKTTLLHALCGIDPAPIGSVSMDETDVRTIDRETRNSKLGYLPQQAQLLPGTLAENISRFSPSADDEKIVAAARLAGVHGLISTLPNSYSTDMTSEGYLLSAGQKQRVALARAVYETPRYLFLDEPNALLDALGERQLADALARLKVAGTTIIMVVHRAGIIGLADKILVLERGQVVDFGPRSEVLARTGGAHRRIRLPVHSASIQDLHDWISGQFVRQDDNDFREKALTIANELYNFACINGATKEDRYLTFEFQFMGPTDCTLTLTEPCKLPIQRKISKIQKIVSDNTGLESNLPSDEQALALVMKLSHYFDFKTNERSSAYCVKLKSEEQVEERITH